MRRLSFVGLVLLLSTAIGCGAHGTVRPWQRGRLAHWSMQSGELEGPGEGHVHAIHEGATGGGSGVESGCGCN